MARTTSTKWGLGGAAGTVVAGIAALCALVVPQTGAADYIGGGQAAEVNEFLNPEVLIVYQGDMTGPILLKVPIVKAVTLVPSSIFGSVAEMQFKFKSADATTFEASVSRQALATANVTPDGGSVVNIPISPSRTTVVAQIIGTKASGQRARDTDRITLTCCVPEDSDPPVADAGPDQSVVSGGMVTLNGSASFDPDGDDLTYQWEQIDGPIVALSDDNSPTPSFRAPGALTGDIVLKFALSVNDGIWTSFADEVTVRVLMGEDPPPTACATYSPAEPRSGDTVTLDGSCSSDGQGPVTCAWMQTSGPPVTLVDPSACVTTFIAPQVLTSTNLGFTLTVTDNGSPPGTDSVDLMIAVLPANRPPVANAGDDKRVCENLAVTLDGSATFDPDAGDTFTCAWSQLPGGTQVSISGAGQCVAAFRAPDIAGMSENLVFQLMATDNHGASDSDEVAVTVVGDPTDPACVQTVSVSGVSAVSSVPSITRKTR
jgi:hypothetical protein